MKVVQISPSNKQVYLNLLQGYEAEISGITRKLPDGDGVFSSDTPLSEHTPGFLAYDADVPIGFATIQIEAKNYYEVSALYIVPAARNKRKGTTFMMSLWHRFPGTWVTQQIEGAEYATLFWRSVIGEFTNGRFEEDKFIDAYWGLVTRQTFSTAL